MKILVIDDDEGMRRMAGKILRARGYEVFLAANGMLGMAIVHRENPQIVITDIIMPVQEGIETILAIHREKPEIKIIAMSGGSAGGDLDLLHMAQLLGADDILKKPFSANDLLDRISAFEAQIGPPEGPPG